MGYGELDNLSNSPSKGITFVPLVSTIRVPVLGMFVGCEHNRLCKHRYCSMLNFQVTGISVNEPQHEVECKPPVEFVDDDDVFAQVAIPKLLSSRVLRLPVGIGIGILAKS